MDPNMYNAFVTLSDLLFKQLYDKLPVQFFLDNFRKFGFAHFAYAKYMMAGWYNRDFCIQPLNVLLLHF